MLSEEDPNVQFGFHTICGGNLVISDDRRLRAERKYSYSPSGGVAYGAKPLQGTSVFEVEIVSCGTKWSDSLSLGVRRLLSNRELQSATDVPNYTAAGAHDHCVWWRHTVYNRLNRQEVKKQYGLVGLDDLREGERVGMMLSYDGQLEFFVNGRPQGVAATGVYQEGYDVYAVVDCYGNCYATRITRAVLDTGTPDPRGVYEEALKSGYVDFRSISCMLNGIAGSGKTSVKCLLFNIPPPEVRESTALAEAPIRATCNVRVSAKGEEWKKMDDDGQDEVLAGEIRCQKSPVQVDLPLDGPPTTATGPSDFDATATALDPLSGQGPDTDQPAVVQPEEQIATPPSTEVDNKLVDLVASPFFQSGKEGIDMVYLLDSGGQPQFTDILSLFVAVTRVMIFVTNLSDTLDDHPMVGYFEDGQPLADPQPSPLSHLEVLQHSVQALQSQAHAQASASAPASPSAQATPSAEASPSAEATVTGPAIIVVGTHRDQEWGFRETRAEKNQKLNSLLRPVFHDQLVYYGEHSKEVIFPVNTKRPNKTDRKVASEIRKAVLRTASSIKPDKIPLRWQVLERAMQRKATELKRAFLTREECLQLAQARHISEKELDAALDHLTRLNVVFYFREALSGIIFVQIQALLDKPTELVHRRYQLQKSPDREKSITGEWIKFRDKGLVSKELLAEFPKHYDDMFTPTHLVELLLYRLVIAEVNIDVYFMPFILFNLSQKDLEEHRVNPSSPAAPLVVIFSVGVAPSGLFPALAASLLSSRSSYSLELYPSLTDSSCPECVYRNCMKFQLPSGTPGSLTLIDSFTHLEAHVDASPSVSSKLCPLIKGTIFSHLKDACSTLKFHSLSPQASVLCEVRASHGEQSRRPFWHGLRALFGKQAGEFRHHAEVSVETKTWKCPQAPGTVGGDLQDRHLLWFQTEIPADEYPSLRDLQSMKWNNNGKPEHTRIMDEVAPRWKELGIALGFPFHELDTIERDSSQSRDCVLRLFGEWSLSKPTYSWKGLIEGLECSGHDNLASRVTRALSRRSW